MEAWRKAKVKSSFIVNTLTIFKIDKENQTLLELRKLALTCAEKENTPLGNTVIDNKVSFFKINVFVWLYAI